MSKKVVIVGGGASGLIAAIYAAAGGASVTVLEQNNRFGKKLLCTGNGKCNLTNSEIRKTSYRGTTPGFAKDALHDFTMADTMAFFSAIGVYTKNKNGYIYPHSEQASTVLELLEMKARSLKVKLKSMEQVTAVKNQGDAFLVFTDNWQYEADAVIVAAGSSASLIEGSGDSGYRLAENFGHQIVKPLPALVPVKGLDSYYGKWAGVRVEAKITLEINGMTLIGESGELQMTDYGISGIPVFQLSRYIARVKEEGLPVNLIIDFMPDFSLEQLIVFLETRMKGCPYKRYEDLLVGIFPKKLIPILRQDTGNCKEQAEKLKSFVFHVDKTLGADHAQVMSGGVLTDEIEVHTMESKKRKNLYFTGEVLDIDGACGGYNLQWAWTSGALAGRAAAKEDKDD